MISDKIQCLTFALTSQDNLELPHDPRYWGSVNIIRNNKADIGATDVCKLFKLIIPYIFNEDSEGLKELLFEINRCSKLNLSVYRLPWNNLWAIAIDTDPKASYILSYDCRACSLTYSEMPENLIKTA